MKWDHQGNMSAEKVRQALNDTATARQMSNQANAWEAALAANASAAAEAAAHFPLPGSLSQMEGLDPYVWFTPTDDLQVCV